MPVKLPPLTRRMARVHKVISNRKRCSKAHVHACVCLCTSVGCVCVYVRPSGVFVCMVINTSLACTQVNSHTHTHVNTQSDSAEPIRPCDEYKSGWARLRWHQFVSTRSASNTYSHTYTNRQFAKPQITVSIVNILH